MYNIVGVSLSKLVHVQDIMSLMSDILHQVNHHSDVYTIYNSQGALKVLLLAGLLISYGI